MNEPRVLIIGQGSIGQRHAQVSRDLGYRTATVSRRDGIGDYSNIADAFSTFGPTSVLIASATSDHKEDLLTLRRAGFDGPVLVEKPLFAQYSDVDGFEDAQLHVAYNLRFSPVVRRLREQLAALDGPVVAAQFLVGQYLPDWRPGRDWQNGYSADKMRGGGVLRDLSHELDLALLLFGPWLRLTALGGALSALPMNADDVWQISAVMAHCPVVSVHLNSLDRVPVRQIRVNSTDTSLVADLIEGTVSTNGEVEKVGAGGDAYHSQMRAFVEGNDRELLCDLRSAGNVLAMIDAVEKAAASSCWIGEGKA